MTDTAKPRQRPHAGGETPLLTRGSDWRTEDLYRTARRLIHKTGRETPDDLWLAAADVCRVAEAHGLHQRVRMTPQRSHEIERLLRELHRVHETEIYQAAGSLVRDLAGDTSTVRREVAIQALGYDDPPKQQPSGAIARALLRDAARRVQAAELGAERHTQYPAARGRRGTDVVERALDDIGHPVDRYELDAKTGYSLMQVGKHLQDPRFRIVGKGRIGLSRWTDGPYKSIEASLTTLTERHGSIDLQQAAANIARRHNVHESSVILTARAKGFPIDRFGRVGPRR